MKKTKNLLYKYIYYNLKMQSEKIVLINMHKTKVRHMLKEILKDSPELFWFEGKIKVERQGVLTFVYPYYVYSKKECAEIEIIIENAMRKYDKSNYVNELHFVREVYKELSDMVMYDASAVHSQNISSVFVNKKSVCRGISKAFQYILQKNGIYCALAEGTIDGVECHVWNIIKIYGEYYHVDVTVGCDCFGTLWKNDDNDVLKNGFFCVSTETIEETHKIHYMPEGIMCRYNLVV